MAEDNIMVDLETMGSGGNAAIISIGAVRFDQKITDRFYEVVSLQSSVDAGLEIEAGTVLWWLGQSRVAQAEFLPLEKGGSYPGRPLAEVLHKLFFWMGADAIVWGNGATFDNPILANAYRRLGISRPWGHRNDRCYRTVKAAHPDVVQERKGTHHNALADAENQAEHLMAIWRKYPDVRGTK